MNIDRASEIVATAKRIATLIVAKDYDQIERMTRGQRWPAEEIKKVVDAHPLELIIPPDPWEMVIDVFEVPETAPRHFLVEFDLWSAAGPADLAVELRFVEDGPGQLRVIFDNIHCP